MIQQGIFMSVTAVRFDSSYLGPFKTFANITNLATILLKFISCNINHGTTT